MSVAVVIPTLNEASGIGQTIEAIRSTIKDAHIIVIDGLSTDGTAEMAKSSGADVIYCKSPGKATAFNSVIQSIQEEYVIMTDADGTYPITKIPDFLVALGSNDVVIGSRSPQPGSMRFINHIGNIMLTKLASLLYGYPIQDVCSGMWGFKSSFLKTLDISSAGFELEVNLFTEAMRKHAKISQIPITYIKRLGESKLRPIDGAKIAWFLMTSRFK